MQLRIFILAVFVCLVLYPQTVRGCSCGPPPTKEQQEKILTAPIEPGAKKWWLEEFKGAVFIGTVIKIEKKEVPWLNRLTRMKKVTVRVERAWVGVTDRTFVIYTNLGKNGDCGVPYAKGGKYFFRAEVVGGQLWTNICSPTNPDNYMAHWFDKMFGMNFNRVAPMRQ